MSGARANRPSKVGAELEADEVFAASKETDTEIVEDEPTIQFRMKEEELKVGDEGVVFDHWYNPQYSGVVTGLTENNRYRILE